MGIPAADTLYIELIANVTKVQSDMKDIQRSVGAMETGVAGSSARAGKAIAAIAPNARQARQGMQQLGFQANDFVTQISSGTSVAQAFAQQLGQTGQALTLMGGGQGALGKVAGFLASGWGIAVQLGLIALTPFVAKLFESEDAAKKSGSATDALADKLDLSKNSYASLTAVVDEYNKSQTKSTVLTYDAILAAEAKARANLKEAQSLLVKSRAFQLSPELLQSGPGAMAVASSLVGDIEREIAKLRDDLAKAGVAAGTERVKRATDPAYAIETAFGTRILRLEEQRKKQIIDQVTYERDRLKLIQQQKAALDALKESEKAARKKPGRIADPSLPDVSGGEVARLIGTRINPGGGTRSAAQNRAAKGAANSYHLIGQAIDIPLTVNGQPLTKAGIRAALEPAGVIIKELLGPGDKGHGDHFHVAFDKKRAAPDEVAEDAAKAAAEAKREYDARIEKSERYRDSLGEQVVKLDQGAIALKRLEIAAGVAAAPTAQLAREIGKAGDEVIRLMQAEETRKRAQEGLRAGVDAFHDAMERAEKARKDASEARREAYEAEINDLRELAGLLDGIGGKTGRVLGTIARVVEGLVSGDLSGIGGKAGAALGLVGRAIGKDGVKDIVDKLDDIFGTKGDGSFAKTMREVLEGAGAGAAVGGFLFGKNNQAAQIGGAIGGAIGKQLGGPIGQLIGSVLGSAVGNQFKKAKTGTATLGFGANGLGIAATGGNSGSRQQAASGLGKNVIGGLEGIAERLGGALDGPISVSIGVRDKSLRVDPTGKGATKKSKGAIDFGQDEAAAIKFAIADAIRDGAITGLRAGTLALLSAGDDIEKQLSKALKFQGALDDLKQRTDPIGFALEALGREFEQLRKIFKEAGAGAADLAGLEQLLALRREEAAEDARQRALTDIKERRSLEIRVLELLGKKEMALAAARELELAGIKASLQPLQSWIFQLEDAREAIDTFTPLLEDLRALRGELLGGSDATGGFAFLREQFRSTAALAADGDAGALGKLRGTANSFLEAARENAGTALDYRRAVGEVLAAVDRGIFAADARVDYAQLQIDAIERNSGILGSIQATLDAQGRAVADNTAKLAKMWERYEGEGLTVKTDADTPLIVEINA